MYHAGNNLEQITDLDDLGGRKTISLFISPASNCLSFSDITSICLPILKSEISIGTICLTKVRKSSLDSSVTYPSTLESISVYIISSTDSSITSIISITTILMVYIYIYY